MRRASDSFNTDYVGKKGLKIESLANYFATSFTSPTKDLFVSFNKAPMGSDPVYFVMEKMNIESLEEWERWQIESVGLLAQKASRLRRSHDREAI